MFKFLRGSVVTAVLMAISIGAPVAQAQQSKTAASQPIIAAASDLQFALVKVADEFKKKTGHSVKLTFGSSGNFARLIRQGAPFDLFFSANEDYVKDLAKDGFVRDSGELYAIGRIVLIVPKGSSLKADGQFTDLKAALKDGRLKKFAIANPEHAPYGARAKEALEHAGVWEAIKPKLVFGENVSQTAQFATSGNTQGGIIAYSLALAPEVSSLGSYELIPSDWHNPLRQSMALTKTASPIAESFFAFARTPQARAIFRKFGFVLPGEAS